MAVILKKTDRGPLAHYITGADAQGNPSWSEDEASALQFVDANAATTFSTGKNILGAVQVTVSGVLNHSKKSCHE